MPELHYLSIAEAAAHIHDGALNPEDLVRAHLARIAELDARVRSYITVAPEIALSQAREAAANREIGKVSASLRGIPVSYKDLIATAGLRTTGASRVYADWVPDRDAHVVTRMRQHGAVTLGKATLNEFAFSANSEEDFIKPARNPWNLTAPAGLSSSGSAAGVAAGLAMASIATDSGGSIRIPASYCGVTGLKPTYGLVGRTGVIPLSYSCDHVGLITRSAEDAAIVLSAIAGHDAADAASSSHRVPDYSQGISRPIRQLRIGICPRYVDAVGIDLEVHAALEESLKVFRSLGASVQEVEVPHLVYAPAADFTILRAEGFNIHLPNLRDKRDRYGVSAFRQIAAGGYLTTTDYYRALQARTLIGRELADMFQSIDILLMPTTPQTAIRGTARKPTENSKVADNGVAFLAPFNLTGSPAMSIPCGFTKAGMPIGLQLVGRAFEEAKLLQTAYAYQSVTNWHRRRPPL